MYPRSTSALVAAAIPLLLLGSSGQAATLAVPSQYRTIGAALENAVAGDVIEIAPGSYLESGLVAPAGVTIAGTGTVAQDVLVNGNDEGRILLLEGLDDAVTIRNITFLTGHARGLSSYDQSGGALLVSNSNARIENCVFSANIADSHGGAIRCLNCSPQIISCQFYANSAPAGGGGAMDISYNSSPLVRDCTFLANRADWGGALSCRGGASARVENGNLTGNVAEGAHGFGGGVFADNFSLPDLLSTTVTDNQARFGGAMVSLAAGAVNLDYCTVVGNKAGILEGGILMANSSPLITGSIVAFNQGRGIAVSGHALPRITCTDIYGNSVGDWAVLLEDMVGRDGNISVDPGFCSVNPGSGSRYYLTTASPLAREGMECGVLGANPVSCGGDKSPVPVASAAIGNVSAAPNPFNPRTTVSFELSRAQEVRVSIHGVDGRLVLVLGEGSFGVGTHELVWNGRDHSGRPSGSGVYFVMIKGLRDTQRLKVTLLK